MKKLIKYDSYSAITIANDVLTKGGIIAYPTDTLYGLGCNAKNVSAIKNLNKIKNRSGPMSVIAPDKKTAISWMELKNNEKNIVKNKLNNGNTVIVPVKKHICSSLITGDNNSLGIRIPENSFCQKLTNLFPGPITSTSVNKTGEKPLTNAKDIFTEFSKQIDLIIDSGVINGTGSKILLYNRGSWKRLR